VRVSARTPHPFLLLSAEEPSPAGGEGKATAIAPSAHGDQQAATNKMTKRNLMAHQ
jgi:hypothetical protein